MKNGHRKNTSSFSDLVIIIIIAFFVSIVAFIFDAFEKFAEWSQRYAHWNIDEIVIPLVILAFAFGIFSWRRWRELRDEITERKRMERALEKEMRQRKTLMAGYRDGIVMISISQDHKVVEANRRFADMLGYTSEEVLNLHTWDWEAVMSKAEIRANFITPPNIVFETRHRRKDGTVFDVEVSAYGEMVDGEVLALCINRDITERKRVEEELRQYRERLEELVQERTAKLTLANQQLQQENTGRKRIEETLARERNWLRTLIDNMPDYIYVKDTESRFLLANIESVRNLGLTRPDELIGKTDFDTCPREMAEQYYADDQTVIESGQPLINREEPGINPETGEMRWLLTTKVPFHDSQGNIVGLVGISRDITTRKRMGEELRKHRNQLEELVKERATEIITINTQLRQEIAERTRAEEVLRKRTSQLEALHKIGLELTAHLNLDVLLHSIASHAVELLGGTDGGLYLYQPDRDGLEWTVAVGPPLIPIGTVLRRGEGAAGKVWDTGKPLIVDDYQHWEGRAENYDKYHFTSVMAVPVCWGDEFLGVLDVNGNPSRTFTQADVELLSLFATQAAIAIRNVSLYEAEQKRATQLAVVNQVARRIVSILDPDQLLQEIVVAIQQGFTYYNVVLLSLDETTRELGGLSVAGGFENIARPDYRQAVGVGLVGCAAKTGQTLLVNDVSQDSRYIIGFQVDDILTKSELSVPLKVADKVIGVLDIQETRVNAFDESDRTALETLADQIAVAIENARLYKAIQQELAERKKAEEALQESVERFALAVQGSNDGIWDWDIQHNSLYWSPRLKEFLGYAADELDMDFETFDALLHPEDRAHTQAAIEAHLKDRGLYEVEQRLRTKSGEYRWFHARGLALWDEAGNPIRMLGSTTDITERKQAEKELQQAKETAEAASQAKSEFLAHMSHELRTPLNGILGYAQILKRDKRLREKQRDAVEIIERSGEHLLMMINNILDLSKIEAGKMELTPTDFHLPELVRMVGEIARIQAQQKGISLDYVLASDLHASVHGDKILLRQILLNLLGNAIKFTERGGIVLQVTARSSRFSDFPTLAPSQADSGLTGKTRSDKSLTTNIRFQIKDTGVGIPSEQLNEIFEPFRQVKNPRIQSKGIGLGLAISQRLLRLMNSELHVESTVEQGSTFWFDVELPKVERITASPLQPSHHIIGFKGRKRNVLLVDDDHDNRTVLREMLSPLGFEITEAIHGRDALEKAVTFPPDIILMDLFMPEMDGFEATRRIRELDTEHWTLQTQHGESEMSTSECPVSSVQCRIPIIAISANAFEQTRQESAAAGCDDFLVKPFDVDDLLEQLQIHLNLEWLYEDDPEGSHFERGAHPVEQEQIILPPADELAPLCELIRKGDIMGVYPQADRLEQVDRKYAPFAIKIRQLAKAFRIDELEAFINTYMEDKT